MWEYTGYMTYSISMFWRHLMSYLKIRHFVQTRHASLTLNISDFILDTFFLKDIEVIKLSKFYSMISHYKADNLILLEKAWSKNYNVTLTELSAMILSDYHWISQSATDSKKCNIILYILICLQINIAKINTTVSPQRPKCNNSIGTFFHCLWECPLVADFWNGVCDKLSVDRRLQPPHSCACCVYCPPLFLEYSDVFKTLLMLGRKLIMNKLVGTEPPHF